MWIELVRKGGGRGGSFIKDVQTSRGFLGFSTKPYKCLDTGRGQNSVFFSGVLYEWPLKRSKIQFFLSFVHKSQPQYDSSQRLHSNR